ncbi:lipoprotein N-acyltransferase Lnb domain-containing protein [Pseudoxanthomonas sp. 10H]|uniref:lipoprotein N-acyltransferase Lnb domain-containing protein n=1 Tax=Pseudoxanthomonas sp. 10H TaxID=3242729 RepID=UPI003555D507
MPAQSRRPAWPAVLAACALLLALLPPFAARAADAPRIGVMTMQPGEVFFERFGHDAIVVVDPDSGEATSYNFGFFDPTEPDFLPRFLRGEMMYHLVALPAGEDLAQYRAAGRGVSVQWLDLEPAQARALADALAERARPENSRYRYDYFTANCATQVRDALDDAMGGALRAQLAGRSRGNTYRSEAVRLARPAPWMWLGFDAGLGPYADRPLSRWEEAFVPMRLADSLREARNSAGRPLVLSEEPVLPHRIAPEPEERPRRWWPALVAGLALAAAVFAARRRPRLVAGLALPLWLLCGLAGALLVFIWGFTAHQAGWANRNLFWLSPLCLLLIPGAVALLRGRAPGRLFRPLLWSVAGLAALGWVLHWLSLQPQYTLPWIALLLPVHAALALALGRATPPR